MAGLSGTITLQLNSFEQYEQYLEVVDSQEGLDVIGQDPDGFTITAQVNLEV